MTRVKTFAAPLQEVADLYVTASEYGLPPVVVIARRLGSSRQTAQRMVREAREAGFLAPDVLVRNAKLLAVATAVGVDYDALAKAILEHADGDLRVAKGVLA